MATTGSKRFPRQAFSRGRPSSRREGASFRRKIPRGWKSSWITGSKIPRSRSIPAVRVWRTPTPPTKKGGIDRFRRSGEQASENLGIWIDVAPAKKAASGPVNVDDVPLLGRPFGSIHVRPVDPRVPREDPALPPAAEEDARHVRVASWLREIATYVLSARKNCKGKKRARTVCYHRSPISPRATWASRDLGRCVINF